MRARAGEQLARIGVDQAGGAGPRGERAGRRRAAGERAAGRTALAKLGQPAPQLVQVDVGHRRGTSATRVIEHRDDVGHIAPHGVRRSIALEAQVPLEVGDRGLELARETGAHRSQIDALVGRRPSMSRQLLGLLSRLRRRTHFDDGARCVGCGQAATRRPSAARGDSMAQLASSRSGQRCAAPAAIAARRLRRHRPEPPGHLRIASPAPAARRTPAGRSDPTGRASPAARWPDSWERRPAPPSHRQRPSSLPRRFRQPRPPN